MFVMAEFGCNIMHYQKSFLSKFIFRFKSQNFGQISTPNLLTIGKKVRHGLKVKNFSVNEFEQFDTVGY